MVGLGDLDMWRLLWYTYLDNIELKTLPGLVGRKTTCLIEGEEDVNGGQGNMTLI